MKLRWTRTGLALAAGCFLAACSTTSLDFVQKQTGYSVTRGRLLRINGLVSETVTRVSDGVVFAIDSESCQVALEFADGSKRVIELSSPDQLVCGAGGDFVLQPARDSGKRALEKPQTGR